MYVFSEPEWTLLSRGLCQIKQFRCYKILGKIIDCVMCMTRSEDFISINEIVWNSFLKFYVMGRTKIDLFCIAHVKVEFIPVLKIYAIRILGRFVYSTHNFLNIGPWKAMFFETLFYIQTKLRTKSENNMRNLHSRLWNWWTNTFKRRGGVRSYQLKQYRMIDFDILKTNSAQHLLVFVKIKTVFFISLSYHRCMNYAKTDICEIDHEETIY